MSDFGKQYTTGWAYDLAKDVISTGEVYDNDAIEQSIENIIATMFSERLFLPNFGSALAFALFENISSQTAELLLDSVIDTINIWENRIVIQSTECALTISSSDNSLSFSLPYIIKETSLESVFERIIRF
jgi:phage baseplate assembly protein W